MSPLPLGGRSAAWLSAALLAAAVAYLYAPVLACPTSCIVDPIAVRGPGLGHIELPDVHLNAWILGWVQRALLHDPSGLFDANVFHPTRAALTQSEHMLSVAFWTLPLRIFSSSAVWLHQVALVGSSWILGLTTAALVRWLCGSALAGFAAGLAAIFMPWRFTELAHVQLMSAQWFPLVWLYLGRVLEEPARRRDGVLLSAALALQLLSSFYLAYFLLLSCAALLLGLWIVERPGAAAWKRLALAFSLPAAGLVASALPYLRWSRERGFQAVDRLFDSVPPVDVLALTLPTPGAAFGYPLEIRYGVPLVVLVLAAVAAWSLRSSDAHPRERGFVLGLALACAAAFVFALGRRLAVGELSLPLPGSLAAWLVPGFENLRNPLRFAIVIGVATPVLAGLGFARIVRSRHGRSARSALAAGTLALLALSLATPPLPARDAWQDGADRLPAYRALASLPEGPVVELPWPLQTEHDAIHAARAMLGSTLHWMPLLNGHSGYVPASYPLLRQRAQALPSARGLADLQELVAVRWILLRHDELTAPERQPWDEAVRTGRLRSAFGDAHTRLLEVVDWQGGGRFEAALASPAGAEATLAGHSRAPLEGEDARGRLAIEEPGTFHFAGRRRLPRQLALRIENRGARTWPGLDPNPEGLVRLRYAFLGPDGEAVVQESSALAADVPPGVSALSVPVSPPARAGRYALRAELVQQRGNEEQPLEVPALLLPVEVRAAL